MKHVWLTLVLGFASSTVAQTTPALNSPLSSIFSKIATQAQNGQASTPPANANVTDGMLTYRPSATVSAEIRAVFVNSLVSQAKQNGPLTAANEKLIRDEFAKVDIAAEYQKALKPKGYDVYNVATAMTVYVLSSFEILDDMQTTDATDRATFEQFRGALKAIPAMRTLSDADKQKFSESLLWLTAFQMNDVDLARANTPGYTMEDVKAGIRAGLKSFNFDPDLVKVGVKGLQARK